MTKTGILKIDVSDETYIITTQKKTLHVHFSFFTYHFLLNKKKYIYSTEIKLQHSKQTTYYIYYNIQIKYTFCIHTDILNTAKI